MKPSRYLIAGGTVLAVRRYIASFADDPILQEASHRRGRSLRAVLLRRELHTSAHDHPQRQWAASRLGGRAKH